MLDPQVKALWHEILNVFFTPIIYHNKDSALKIFEISCLLVLYLRNFDSHLRKDLKMLNHFRQKFSFLSYERILGSNSFELGLIIVA